MLVIGNGESRSQIDIDKIVDTKIGCNAVIRDYYVDHLICVDRRMVQESIDTGAHIYTRPDWYQNFNAYKNIKCVPKLPYKGDERPDEPFQWGSGPYAVLLGAMLSNNVDMIGFDLWSITDTVNNIYKDTSNYDPKDKNPVDPRYWIHQIAKVFQYYPQVEFIIYQKQGWNLPETWIQPNVSLDKISKFM
jgi:hypothetical protein